MAGTKVEVVNRQEIDGKEYKRGQVAEFSSGRAADLIAAGKARVPADKQDTKPKQEVAKNG